MNAELSISAILIEYFDRIFQNYKMFLPAVQLKNINGENFYSFRYVIIIFLAIRKQKLLNCI